jgi:hypothetical protein
MVPEAISLYEKALALARRTGHLRERAFAQHELGVAHRVAGNDAEAVAHLEAALVAYTELRAPEAEEVRVLLAEFERQPSSRSGDRLICG